jgi:exodeoxyribonuclease VII large subunit
MNGSSEQPRVYTVSEITRNIKKSLEGKQEFTGIWIKGEIFNLTFHSSGHIYFTLKDNDAVIAAVFFRYANKNLTIKLKEGMNVLAFGNITVFEKRGSYQINVSMVRLEGIGDLQMRIEQLKAKLMHEGIFDPKRKKNLPFMPQRLGIVTSPTGAAVRDIIKVALRRYPNLEIVIAPAIVQGENAPVSIVKGIEELNRSEYKIDCIIAGRGGGSFEDLMSFNEEIVVRAFYNSRVPIISAVGHQIDHPLSDDAADMAAPTPSAAAEIAVPVKKEFMDEIDYFLIRANNAVESSFRELGTIIDAIANRRVFRHPYEIISKIEMTFSDAWNRVLAGFKEAAVAGKNRYLSIPDIHILIKNTINNKAHAYNMLLKTLEQLSPKAVLQRGYAIALNEKNSILRSVAETDINRLIRLLMYDGSLRCTVNFIEKEKTYGKEK